MAVNLKQVYSWLGISADTHDLGYICNNSKHKKINKWSLRKPMQYNGSDWYKVLTDAKCASVNWGWKINTSVYFTYHGIRDLYRKVTIPDAFIVAPADEYYKLGCGWEYVPNTSKHRLSDWQYYDAGADWIVRVYPTTTAYQTDKLIFNFETQVNLNHLSDKFSSCYLGIIMWKGTECYWKTMTTNLANSSGTLQQIEFAVLGATTGEWQCQPFLASEVVTNLYCDKALSYYNNKGTTGQCFPIPIETPHTFTVNPAPVRLVYNYGLATTWNGTTSVVIALTCTINNEGTTEQSASPDASYKIQGYNDSTDSWVNITSGVLAVLSQPSTTIIGAGGSASWSYRSTAVYSAGSYKKVRVVAGGLTREKVIS